MGTVTSSRLTKPPSEHELQTRTRLAWRPAWSIRNRQGSVALIVAWWRHKRALRLQRKSR